MDGFCDDPTILDGAALWRRIPPWHFVTDQNLGVVRPSSAAFENDPDDSPMSVFLAEIIEEAGRTADDTLVGHAGFALSAFTAGLARHLKQGVAPDPEPNEPAHAVVFGAKPKKSVCRVLAKKSEWVIPPPDRLAR